TLFIQELTDEITRVNDPRILNQFYNTGGIETKGIEWALKYMPVENWIVYWNGSYQKAEVKAKTLSGGVTVSEACNSDDEPLFVPELTSFIGTEISLADVVRVNLALRNINSIPYITAEADEDKASVNFIDLTLRTKKFLDNKLSLELVALNLLDNDDRVPSFGEHAGNTTGTLAPEGRRFYVRATLNY
ncbi:MAG: TonB-dependent receptor, partial [Candidatus Aureabacteria bacterium]|nr:TonB-dependent receptor [Candidatus Auribacterota bacterium]